MSGTLSVSDHEKRVLVRALKRLRYDASLQLRKNAAANWQPATGKADVHAAVVSTANDLLVRLTDLPEDA